MLEPDIFPTSDEPVNPTAISPHQHATCRSCGAGLKHVVVDLGLSPLANSYLSNEDLHREEPRYPLRVFVCAQCFLVQLEAWETPENIFGDYAYFSSYSQSWLKHAETYVSDVIARFGAKSLNQVIEIASNDGYLLQYFRERGVSVLGIEPARNVAEAARDKGIPTRSVFFGEETARALRSEGIAADLLIGNNVLAHVPDLNDFVEGIRIALADYGVVTMEFPHLMRLMEGWQIDTIYHEHFSYFSLLAVQKVFEAHDMTIFDVEELSTHGGSLRIYAQHRKTGRQQISDRVAELKDRELRQGYGDLACYLAFGQCAQSIRTGLRKFLVEAKLEGKRVVGYGAPAKGNTLLNYCGIGTDLIEFTVDRSPHKQGKYLPGSHIPILDPDAIAASKPDYIVILPWNLKDEIVGQMSMARSWGGKFVVPIPRPTIVE